MGTTSCQMTIISWIFFFITLQKTKVRNLILAFVLSGLLKKSLLFLFKKRKLSTCNKKLCALKLFDFHVFSSCFMVKRDGLPML